MWSDLANIIAPIFLIAGLGIVWIRLGQRFETEFVTRLVSYIGSPCLVFHTLTNNDLDPSLIGTIVLGAVLCLLLFALIGSIVLKLTNMSLRTFLPSLLIPNTGNMGLPLCLLAFGPEGLALAIAYFTVSATTQFTFGIAIASGTANLKMLLRTPLIYAVIAALACLLTGTKPYPWLTNTSQILGGITIPLLLLTLGISLAKLKLNAVGRSLFISVIRLGMGLGVGLGIAHLLDLEGAVRGVLILESAMPVAVLNYLFAQQYRTEPEAVASAVVVSTALSFATLPFLLMIVL